MSNYHINVLKLICLLYSNKEISYSTLIACEHNIIIFLCKFDARKILKIAIHYVVVPIAIYLFNQ